jgi:septum formation topological specificity factor MinE
VQLELLLVFFERRSKKTCWNRLKVMAAVEEDVDGAVV